MAYGVNLGEAGVPACDALIKGETKEEVMNQVRQHLSSDHAETPITDTLLATIEAAIRPIQKD